MQNAPTTQNAIADSAVCATYQSSHTLIHHLAVYLSANRFSSDNLYQTVIDSLRYGILVVTDDHHLLYANDKAKEFCQSLSEVDPHLIEELCDRCHTSNKTLTLEYVSQHQQQVRIKVQNLPRSTFHRTVLILLENCDETFQAERSIQSQKYALTKRETEVWTLLQQEYTYQEAATYLGLSINTLKTHVKSIHRKQHEYQQTSPNVWCSR